jgi:hypothetical protein
MLDDGDTHSCSILKSLTPCRVELEVLYMKSSKWLILFLVAICVKVIMDGVSTFSAILKIKNKRFQVSQKVVISTFLGKSIHYFFIVN